jgi:tRNA A-37 threonylcarbamoyl transferase component Bud32
VANDGDSGEVSRALLEALDRAPLDVQGTARLGDLVAQLEQMQPPRDGRYEVVGVVAEGATSQVRLSRDAVLGRLVAVKAMRRGQADRPQRRRRFLTEAHLTAQLDHPHVVPVYELVGGEVPAYAMKFVDGVTLEQRLVASVAARAAGGEVPEELSLAALLDVLEKLCDVLAYAHDRGVLHRGLKPEHVMLGRHGEVYVMDWSLARVVDADDTLGVDAGDETLPGQVVGAPHYLAPEQARGDLEALGPAVDQFALGLVLYEMVCGRRARPDLPLGSLLQWATEGRLRPMTPLGRHEGLPPALVAIVRKATALDPARRYPSVRQLAADLRRYRRDEPVHALPEGLQQRLARALARRASATLTAMVALFVLVGTAVAVAGVGSASAALGLQYQVAAAEARWSSLVTEVGDRAGRLDRAMALAQAHLRGLDEAAEALLVAGVPETGEVVLPPEAFADPVRRPRDTSHSSRYDRLLSTRWPAAVAAPDTSLARVDRTLRTLMPLRHRMRRAHLEVRQRLQGLDAAAADRAWRDEEGPIRWTFVGTEDGAYFDLPGAQWDASGYDPRQRPWYVLGRDTDHPRWGGPYPEASTGELLLPCASGLHAPDGRLLGVVGMDIAFSYLIERHLGFDHPAALESFLVDGQARVLVRSSEVGPRGRPTSLDETWATPPFEHPELADALSEQRGVLSVDGGATRLVHVPLATPGWWYVVAFDAGALDL